MALGLINQIHFTVILSYFTIFYMPFCLLLIKSLCLIHGVGPVDEDDLIQKKNVPLPHKSQNKTGYEVPI
jgi:hypothetical protein